MSFHGRYVIAQGEAQAWSLHQSLDLGQDGCGWFTRYELGKDSLGNVQIALETCKGRFVTAPRRGTSRLDREVWQESGLGDCSKFTVLPQGGDSFALKTCAGTYLTAGNDSPGWESPLQWGVVGEATKILDWEKFTIVPR